MNHHIVLKWPGSSQVACRDVRFGQNWVRWATNGTNLGFFSDHIQYIWYESRIFSDHIQYILAHRAKMY